jgi:hypothetical protein
MTGNDPSASLHSVATSTNGAGAPCSVAGLLPPAARRSWLPPVSCLTLRPITDARQYECRVSLRKFVQSEKAISPIRPPLPPRREDRCARSSCANMCAHTAGVAVRDVAIELRGGLTRRCYTRSGACVGRSTGRFFRGRCCCRIFPRRNRTSPIRATAMLLRLPATCSAWRIVEPVEGTIRR